MTNAKGQKLAGASFIEGSPSEATAAAGIEATGGGGTGQVLEVDDGRLPAAQFAQAAAHVDRLALDALRALAAPSTAEGHMAALAQLRAATAGAYDLPIAQNRHARPEPTIDTVRPPWHPIDPALAAAAAAVLAVQEKS